MRRTYFFYKGSRFTWLNSMTAVGLLLWRCTAPAAEIGNWDYYNPGTSAERKSLFGNIHKYHLQPGFDALKRGAWKEAKGNFEFVLRGYPNSPQALNGISELCATKWKSPQCDADAWFEKAVAINPAIATTWVLYGIHLQRKKRPAEAVERYQQALKLRPDDVNGHYNLGLAYFELKEYEKANAEAQASYALGAPLPGLRDKLIGIGMWKPLPDIMGAEHNAYGGGLAPKKTK